MKKFCTKCGHEFDAIGREVICPSCKAQAAEETKRAAVLKAKRASWAGESVPVRIGGRASTVIREYGAVHNLPFAAALDALLKGSEFFLSTGKAWEEVEPYRSHRRDKSNKGTTETAQEAKQVQAIDELLKQAAQEVKTAASKPQDKPQDVPQEVKQAAKATSKATASKASASKAAGKAASKASASKAKK